MLHHLMRCCMLCGTVSHRLLLHQATCDYLLRTAATTGRVVDCEQAWQVTHPPKRGMLCNGTRPLVHRGFLASWTAKGFNERVVERLRVMVSEVPKQQRARVLVTGAPMPGNTQ